jgi:hypothetical protein
MTLRLPGWSGWAARGAIALVCLVLAAVAALRHRALEQEKAALRDELLALGSVAENEVVRALEREPDRGRAKVIVARALTYSILDARGASPAGALPATATALVRLARARSLALEALAAQPSSWQAHMILGSATYLERSLSFDRRLFTAHRDWETPLLEALQLAPAATEPKRFLAAAYLEIWPALAPAKRETARQLLRDGFADPPTLRRLIGPWLAVASTADEALAPLPPAAWAWSYLLDVLEQRRDWKLLAAARQRFVGVLDTEVDAQLEEAERRLARGEFGAARAVLLMTAASMPPETRFLQRFERALSRLPPGPPTSTHREPLHAWLVWNLERCLFARCALSAATAGRLAAALPELDEHLEARAALAAGDLTRAELLERRSGALWSEEWAPYLLQKASLLLESGSLEEARRTAQRAHRGWQQTALMARLLASIETATRKEGGSPATTTAHDRDAAMAATAWSAGRWGYPFAPLDLELYAALEAPGLWLHLQQMPAGGGLLEIRLDGSVVAVEQLRPSKSDLKVATPVAAGLHLLALRPLGGVPPRPGRVELLPP